jgi:hypothetical protein
MTGIFPPEHEHGVELVELRSTHTAPDEMARVEIVRIKDADDKTGAYDLFFLNQAHAPVEAVDAAVRRVQDAAPDTFQYEDLVPELAALGLVEVTLTDATQQW